MLQMLCRNRVIDYDHWKKIFDRNERECTDSGLVLKKMWRCIEDPNNVFFLFDVTDKEKATEFVNSPESAKVGEEAGVIDGELYYVEVV